MQRLARRIETSFVHQQAGDMGNCRSCGDWSIHGKSSNTSGLPTRSSQAGETGSEADATASGARAVPPATSGSKAPKSVASATDCGMCLKPLGKSHIDLGDDRKVCEDCFVCASDGAPIDGEYAEQDGKLYCDEHFTETFCTPCGGCSQRIKEGAAVTAQGKTWHPECFCCAKCQEPLSGGGADGALAPFKFHVSKGGCYCEKDYLEYLCDKCPGCGFPVESGLKAIGATWHQECFVCTECREPFQGGFVIVDGQPYCEQDAAIISGLSSEDRALLQALPPAPAPTDPGEKPTAEERGACLSLGIADALRALTTLDSRPCSVYSDQMYKERTQLKLTSGKGDRSFPFDFEAFAPTAFRTIRQSAFNVDEKDYLRSTTLRPLSGGQKGEGKSGELFFFSWDHRFIVKTVRDNEVPFFVKCLKDYHQYLCAPDQDKDNAGCTQSMLPKFLGLYSMKFASERPQNVVVMFNVFPNGVKLTDTYDLKGVLGAAREVTPKQRAEGIKVMKDRNFVERGDWQVGPEMKKRLVEQIKKDCKFLQDRDRMDYSMLIGIASDKAVKEKPNPTPSKQWCTVECNGLQSMGEDGVAGDEIFYAAIIDILQEYNARKAVESTYRTMMYKVHHLGAHRNSLSNEETGVSAMPASHYGKRFASFMEEHMK